MSGPKRELPPIHVKITGDPSGGLKAIQDVVDASKQAGKDIGAAGKKQTKAAQKEHDKQYDDVVNFFKKTLRAGKKNSVDFYKEKQKVVKQQEKQLRDQGKLLPSFAKTAKSAKSGMPDLNAVIKDAEQNAKTQANNLAKANTKLATHVKNGAKIQAERAEGMKSAAAKERAIQQSASEELAKEVQKTRDRIAKQNKQYEEDEQRATDRRRMRRRKRLKQEKADQDRMVAERKKIRQAQVAGLRQRGRALGSQAMGAFSGGGMMGARADIYMHQETLKSMGAAIMDLVRPFAQVENYSIQMEAFAGSAEKAKDAIAQLQAYAVGSPYTLEGVLNASTVMMKYGAEVEHAVKMTKLLGDVAAGDTHKLELMALAVGQAQALGRFQGQELRQMVNAGFNPLAIAAKEMAGPGADKAAIQKQMKLLQENMRAGALDSGIIEAALQIATSEGGDFAGLAYKQANTLTGLASQILETFDLFRIEIVKVFAEDLTALMKVTLQYVQALVEWAKNNKQAVKEWVNFVIQVAEAIALFSAAAMVLAYFKWIMGSLIIVLGPIIFMMKLLGGTLSLLIGVWRVVGTAAMVAGAKTTIAWLAATAPIWGIPVAIAAAVAAFTAITVVVEGFSRKGGFASVFHDGIKAGMAFLGFMYNLEHNLKAIFEGVEKNQGALTYDTLITNNPNMQLLRTAAKAVGAGGAFSGVEAEARKGITGKGSTGKAGYNTSMFKFDLPKTDIKSVLGGMDSMLGVSEALKPYLKPLEGASTIGDKPNIDFSQFLGKGGKGGGTSKPVEHALRGSAEHAVRMYEYGQSARPAAADPKQQHQQKVETLLGEIAKNTRLNGPLQGGTGIEEAALTR
jgi:hypothetical protein